MKNKSFIFVFLVLFLFSCGGKGEPSTVQEHPTVISIIPTVESSVPSPSVKPDLSGPIDASGAAVYIIGESGIFLDIDGHELRLYSDEKENLYGHYTGSEQSFFILAPDSMEEGIAMPLIVPDPLGFLLKIGYIARQERLWLFLVIHDP